ncbi:cyclic nucleotide-binding domain-containing protein [Legionella israelensis]|uniref:patatin-like phospholipase family protein n=1 Tax=Legionella israelensis TaxID=454 RepID=UPI00117FA3EB|nr:patatin-like phospholipase family protein [Legionella israelensis]QDP71886.1 cyclic nucleotide-binding domain-containing protein [Legionella israelensis]
MSEQKKVSPVLNEQNLLILLKKVNFLKTLKERQIKKLVKYCEQVNLSKDEILFRQADPSDGFYILSSGQLAAILENDKGKQVVGIVHPGETVGELGGLSHCPRTLTIKTLTDAVLIRFSHENIKTFMDKYGSAELYMQLLDTIIARSQSVIKLLGNEKLFHHSVLIPAANHPVPEAFIDALKKNTHPNHRLLLVDDTYLPEEDVEKKIEKIREMMKQADENCQRLLFIIKTSERLRQYLQWYMQHQDMPLFQNIDGLFVIADASKDSTLSEEVKQLLKAEFAPFLSRKELILLHEPAPVCPKNTKRWLAEGEFSFHHHLRYRSEDFLRLLRFILDKPNAMVLSGGGAKGWAAVGAIKALQESGIPIDAIAGTSAGSIFSSAFALCQDYKAAYQMIKPIAKIGYKMFAPKHWSYPLISVTSAKHVTHTLQEVFGDLQVEDLWLPNFSVAVNLNTGKEVFQSRGAVWEAVRCSTSIPLVYPPFTKEGEMIADGGLLNNLPVDKMREFTSHGSFVFALNLKPFTSSGHYDFPPIITFINGLMRRCNLIKPPYHYPSLVDIFLKSLMIGSLSRTIDNAKASDVLISPEMEEIPWLNLPPDKIELLIDMGYTATMKEIKNLSIEANTQILSNMSI